MGRRSRRRIHRSRHLRRASIAQIEEAFGDFPTIRFRDECGIGGLGRFPDGAMIKPVGHELARSIGQTVEDERIKSEAFARIIETAAPVASKKTVACAPGDLVKMPFVLDNCIARCFCAKRCQPTIGQGAGFTCHKRDESPNDGLLKPRSTSAATDRKMKAK